MLTQGYSEAALLWNDIKKIREMDTLRLALQQQVSNWQHMEK
jgi:hypothetical protein